VSALSKKAIELNPASHLAERPMTRARLVPMATMSIHFGATVYWILSFKW
jgi:hypothetical protein